MTDHVVGWRPVGDRENNLATINIGSDPAAGLVERVTNAIDAVLEREWIERGEPSSLRSPRQAVELWFRIRDGRLENISDATTRAVVDLSRRVQIALRDSAHNERPTVDIRDFGTGIQAQDFASSILGLNETRKLKRFFLAGAFGQGGSTALSYSPYTIIASRRFGNPASSTCNVAATIVRFNQGDLDTDKHGVYEYMVNKQNGHPFIFPCLDEDFLPGTLVRHVAMDLGKYKNIMTAPTGSLWYLTHHYLFDPVIPFRIREERQNASYGAERFVGGNHRRLTQGQITEYQQKANRTFRSGGVTITWWVLSADGEDARNRITNYCLASRPIIITYNGQKQGELPNTVIKSDLKLPYLERYLVVHVDCDRLDNESRRQLFPTTRESLRDTSILNYLRQLVVETLDGDDELRRLDRERKQRYMQRADSASVENLQRRLANRINQLIKAGGTGSSPTVPPPDPTGRGPTAPHPPIPVQEPPTFLEILGPRPREVYSGRPFTLRFKTDADPTYFRDPDAFIAIIDPPSFGQYTGTTSVRHGYGVAYFRADETQTTGDTGEITLEVRPRRARTLKDSITARVVAIPDAVGSSAGASPRPNINVRWIGSDDQFWKDHGWNENAVAEVEWQTDAVDIYVSSENKKLSQLIARAQRRDTTTVDGVKDFYLEHISFHAMIADLNEQRIHGADASAADEADETEVENRRERELQRVCETVCGIAEQMFEFVAIRAEAAAD